MDPISISQTVYASIEAGDMATVASYLTDDFTFGGPLPEPVGKDMFLQLQGGIMEAFPDWKFHAGNYKAQGNVVTGTVQITGTHTGTLHAPMPGMPDIPATGKRISLPQVQFKTTMRGDKISSVQLDSGPDSNLQALLRQIGVQMPH